MNIKLGAMGTELVKLKNMSLSRKLAALGKSFLGLANLFAEI
jgi:hypothetical protein